MSGKVKQRSNVASAVTVSTNEKILREVHQLYTHEDRGLVCIAESVGLKLLAPRKKITVLLIGNHSAGKSSFINWYIEEHALKTGVAIETQGFVFVTSGRKRESLTGNATLHLYPHFRQLQDKSGVVDFLATEVSTSKQKKFSLITFIDTPGLVDGDMKYPFDLDNTILWLGDRADLIFVFFDPIGQALCKRTLNLVEHLNEKHTDRMKFYLSKADEAGHESDRQRVLMQIVQELCKRPGLNKAGFDMPTIYIPNIMSKPSRCVNQIDDVCKDLEKTINQTIQSTLNQLEKDCEIISDVVHTSLNDNQSNLSYNRFARMRSFLFGVLGLLVPIAFLCNFLLTSVPVRFSDQILGPHVREMLHVYTVPVTTMWDTLPDTTQLYISVTAAVLSVIFIILAMTTKYKSTLSRRQKRNITDKRDYVQTFVKQEKKRLYKEYLDQCLSEHDLN